MSHPASAFSLHSFLPIDFSKATDCPHLQICLAHSYRTRSRIRFSLFFSCPRHRTTRNSPHGQSWCGLIVSLIHGIIYSVYAHIIVQFSLGAFITTYDILHTMRCVASFSFTILDCGDRCQLFTATPLPSTGAKLFLLTVDSFPNTFISEFFSS